MIKTVLMIDDNKEMCQEMAEVLRNEGYQIRVALDGLKGRKLIKENDYDVLLLDLKLPGLSGLDILKSVKEMKKKLKVFVLTGKPLNGELPGEENRGKDEEILKLADGLISKPFDVQSVLGKIKESTGNSRT